MADKEYIERGALIERLKRRRDSERFPRIKFAGLESAIFQVKHLPTADVVEVRHGEWEILLTAIIDTIGKCTNCGGEAVWRTRLKPYTLCPHCGAKMGRKG